MKTAVMPLRLKCKALGWSLRSLAWRSGESLLQIRRMSAGRISESEAVSAVIHNALMERFSAWREIFTANLLNLPPQLPCSSFGELLRNKRHLAGLSREGLAKITRLSPCTIKFVEVGKTKATKRTCLLLLAAKPLGLTIKDLPSEYQR